MLLTIESSATVQSEVCARMGLGNHRARLTAKNATSKVAAVITRKQVDLLMVSLNMALSILDWMEIVVCLG